MKQEVNNKWVFPLTNGGKKTGFNESGIQFFKDDTLLSLAREICQNSLDAKDSSSSEPVRVDFNSFYLNKENFLGYEDFYDIICKEVDFAKKYYINDKNPFKFYMEAKKLLESDKILCLRISDFNTTGLTGSDRTINSKWDRLVKGEGFSDNPGTSGGSFGIGHNAAFACSKLNTVFYSTKDIYNLTASQGVAKLSSCELENGNITQGAGFYGKEKNENNCITLDRDVNQLYLDPTFTLRENFGTDIYILGFDSKDENERYCNLYENWVIDVAASIIDNYFVSILDNKLVININNLKISKENIVDIFDYIYNLNNELFNQYTADYFNILATNKYDVIIKKFSMFQENDVELSIAFDSNFKNRIAVIKGTGMKIFDKDRMPQISFYSGVLKLMGNTVNEYFRQMENPKHDEWYPSKMSDYKEARKQYNTLFEFVKSTIRELVENSTPESIDAEGIGEFLPDEEDVGKNSDLSETINNEILEEVEVNDMPTSKESNIATNNSDNYDNIDFCSENEDGEVESDYNQGRANQYDGGFYDESKASMEKGDLELINIKGIQIDKSRCFFSNGKYEFKFTCPTDVNSAHLVIEIAGEQANYKPRIKNAYCDKKLFSMLALKVKKNVISIGKIKKDEVYKVKFELDENETWALEVKLYEN